MSRHGKHWTLQEYNKLASLKAQNATIDQIAVVMDRSPTSIEFALDRLAKGPPKIFTSGRRDGYSSAYVKNCKHQTDRSKKILQSTAHYTIIALHNENNPEWKTLATQYKKDCEYLLHTCPQHPSVNDFIQLLPTITCMLDRDNVQ